MFSLDGKNCQNQTSTRRKKIVKLKRLRFKAKIKLQFDEEKNVKLKRLKFNAKIKLQFDENLSN